MTTQVTPTATVTGKKRAYEKLIDCDVHPEVNDKFSALLEYMPKYWQDRMAYMANKSLVGFYGGSQTTGRVPHPRGNDLSMRVDEIPPGGGPLASDPEFLKEVLLDKYGIDTALLIALEPAANAVGSCEEEHSATLVSAWNRYMLDHWMVDERFRYALVVSPLDPALAAEEIRLHGKNPKVAAVYLPLWGIRMGNRRYNPIYEAAVENGLPIMTHPGVGEGNLDRCATYAGGLPESHFEKYSDLQQIAQANLTSLIAKGTFSKYPDLRVLFIEYGFAWVPSHLWRMDKAWRELRNEIPWVKKWPREYVHDNVKFSTQAFPEPEHPEELVEMFERYLSDSLMFATDYPHWDFDRPASVFSTLSEEKKRKLFYENAASVLRLQ